MRANPSSLRLLARAVLLVIAVLGAGEARAQSPDSSAAHPDAGEPALGGAPPAPPDVAAPLPATRKVRLIGNTRTVVRTGPGDRYAIAGVFLAGRTFPVIARSGEWYAVHLSDSETGWVHASLCKELDDLSGLEFRPDPLYLSKQSSMRWEVRNHRFPFGPETSPRTCNNIEFTLGSAVLF